MAKQEVRRGRKFVEYHDDSQPANVLTQEIGIHDVSYQDEAGNWLAADENWATDGVDGFVLKNDKLNHKIRLKGNGGRTWYPRRNVNTEYITFGVPQYRNGNKWSNFSFSGWSVEGKTITLQTRQGVTILVHNRWNGIKIDWVLASSAAPSRMRYPVSLTGITEIAGVLFGADGTRLGQLTPTTATDANEVELVCSGSFANGYVEFSVDASGAVYPVVIDPDFAGMAADFMTYGQDADYATARSTAYYGRSNGASDPIGQRVSVGGYNIYRVGIKFDTSTIGASATVTQANLKLVATTNASATDFDVQIAKCDWSSKDPFDYSTREASYDLLLTGDLDDSVWLNTNGISINTQYASGNLSTAWINKTGATYYALRSKEDTDASVPTGNEYVEIALSENATESYRPVLSVTYTAAGGALHRINMNAQMSNLTGGIHG